MTQNVDQDMVSILAKASPAHPIQPGLVLFLILGASGGLVVGVAILVLMDQIDDRVSSTVDLQSGFAEHVLAQIPNEKHDGYLEALKMKIPGTDLPKPCALCDRPWFTCRLKGNGRRPSWSPALLRTRENHHRPESGDHHGVNQCSGAAGRRRSSARQSSQWFDRESEPGLTDLLSGEAEPAKCILPTSIANLELLAKGMLVPNPGELFLGPRLNQFLRDVHQTYEYVIFDSSPVMATDDTSSLAPKLDAAIFVLRFAHSSARLSKKALELLRDRQTNVIGIVCNGLSRGHQEYYHYRYPEYYSSGKIVA